MLNSPLLALFIYLIMWTWSLLAIGKVLSTIGSHDHRREDNWTTLIEVKEMYTRVTLPIASV